MPDSFGLPVCLAPTTDTLHPQLAESPRLLRESTSTMSNNNEQKELVNRVRASSPQVFLDRGCRACLAPPLCHANMSGKLLMP
jgi:hypothetical protein